MVIFLILYVAGYSSQTNIDAGIKKTDALYQEYLKTEKQQPLREAAAILDELNASFPDKYSIAWRRARAYYNLGDDAKLTSEKLKMFEQALEASKKAVELNPDGVECHYWLGVSSGGYGEVKGMFKALSLIGTIRKEMDAAIKIDPSYENGGAYLVLGRLDYELPGVLGGSNKRAIQRYEEGLKVSPSNLLMKVYLAESYIDADRKEDARKILDSVLLKNPGPNPDPDLRDAQREARKIMLKHFKS